MSTEEELNIIVKKLCYQKDINNYTLTFHGGNKKGEGFLGEILFFTIFNKDTGKKLDLVIKKAFSGKEIRNFAPIEKSFCNEIFAYSEVWPKLLQFQKDYGIQDAFYKVPKCFGYSKESPNEYVILQNMKSLNYVMIDKKVELDKEHVEFLFKLYGKFHGLSYAFREKEPEKYAKLQSRMMKLFEDFATSKSLWVNANAVIDIAKNALHPDQDKEALEAITKYKLESNERFLNAVKNKGCVTTIVHGDCWSNNMMFKYESGKLEDVALLDWQFVEESHPICDLSYILYSGASESVINDYEKYLQIYYDSFKNCVQQFDCDLSNFFTFQQLKDDWPKHCQLGYTMALIVINIKLMESDEIKDFTDLSNENESIFSCRSDNDELNKRFRSLTLHMHKIKAL